MLYNDDSIEILKNMEKESIDLIVTDIPYKVTPRGTTGGHGMLATISYNSGKVFKHNDVKPKDYASLFYDVLKEQTHCYIMTNDLHLVEVITEFEKAGFHFIKSLIWDKGNKIMNMFYMSQFEYILFFRKGKAKKINNCGTGTILSFPNKKTKDENGKNLHDSEKPVELMKILIENSSKPNDIVVDPFMGIGSTGVACVNTNRSFIGIELDDKYFEIASKRIKEAEIKKQQELF